jgi:hypothetical protein
LIDQAKGRIADHKMLADANIEFVSPQTFMENRIARIDQPRNRQSLSIPQKLGVIPGNPIIPGHGPPASVSPEDDRSRTGLTFYFGKRSTPTIRGCRSLSNQIWHIVETCLGNLISISHTLLEKLDSSYRACAHRSALFGERFIPTLLSCRELMTAANSDDPASDSDDDDAATSSPSSPDQIALMRELDEHLAHVWMVRTFLKHSDEASEDEELAEVHRDLYDYMLALGPSIDRADAVKYLHLARKKLSKLRKATELFLEIQPEVSGHMNFRMAAKSLGLAVRQIESLLSGSDGYS